MKYIYKGPISGATLQPKKKGDKPLEVMFHDGKVPVDASGKPADLDPANPYVARLRARGHLHEPETSEPETSEPAKSKPKKAGPQKPKPELQKPAPENMPLLGAKD